MMQQIANFIVDHDPMMVIRRTHDTVRYIRWVWNTAVSSMKLKQEGWGWLRQIFSRDLP